MDAVSFAKAAKQEQRLKKIIANPDSPSGVVTVPQVIAVGETITIPAGRMAVLPNLVVNGELVADGEVFVPSGSTLGDLDDQIASKASIADMHTAGIPLKTIATGTAIFTATTNNINLTGIGVGVEVGDVIQISGADDAKNNSAFTVEVITDANNVIVNQAHAGKGTTKNVATRAGDTGVTVKLLAKWYNAPIGLGRADVNFPLAVNTTRQNLTGRPILVTVLSVSGAGVIMLQNITTGTSVYTSVGSSIITAGTLLIGVNEIYKWVVNAGSPSIPFINEVR